MFLCRSRALHHAAIAATEAGWAEVLNILEGFEGDKDASAHRNVRRLERPPAPGAKLVFPVHPASAR
jgi:hypothetical protein